jgi:hypothetical protein
MNMTTRQGYRLLYGNASEPFPIRYNTANCGPANLMCLETPGNGDLEENDINRMADYARWLGIPTRSDFTVSLPDVIEGEKIFVSKRCNTCHVMDKISITNPNDTMLSIDFRNRLGTHIYPPSPAQPTVFPFVSYLGTDLLMHDMGYLSHLAQATVQQSHLIRDQRTGVVFDTFKNYVQKIRTPALKGLRFNRFVTDSHRNTLDGQLCYNSNSQTLCKPACDFLLHDGRACDAIEAAFLHDGPEIKALKVIEGLSGLSITQIQQLRAFLYSL